jgi:DNA-binding NarL/FixJ family response regulator
VGTTNVSEPILVAIVEDHEEIRAGLAALLSDSPRFRTTGSWGSMEAALLALEGAPPDIVLVDLDLPGMSGTEGIRRLRASHPDLLLIVLTVYEDDNRIFDALCAGASGYLLKNTPAPRLLTGLEEAVAGGAPMSPEIARRVVGLFSRFRPAPKADYGLTPHESRVLKLLVEGHSYKTAAAILKVATPTVAFHVRRIYEKLRVHSKSEAVAKAVREDVFR